MQRPIIILFILSVVEHGRETWSPMKMAVFWVVAPCILVEVYRRFGGACCLHYQGDDHPDDVGSRHGATTQKTAIFILAAVRT
jgi:hypothetical protein